MSTPLQETAPVFAYFLKVGRYGYAADSLKELSEYFVNVRDGCGLGSSRMPNGYIYRPGEKQPFAHVSYNGRIWAGTRSMADATPIYDNRGG